MWKIPLFDLDYGLEEELAVSAVLQTRWLTMGEVTARFEKEFAAMLGVKHACMVANGTVALHLACAAAGIGPGDEVIVPALTFVASAAAPRYLGATPVFADSTSDTDLCISPAGIESLVTPRTRAVMVMHYGGNLCDMPAICRLAEQHGLQVLEDAAHAPGASLEGRPAGAWGTAAAFSFFSNKNLATGEGGMVTTDDDEIARKVRLLRSHGMTSLTWDRHRGQALSYDVLEPGFNYRPTEISAALGLVQLAKLAHNNARRRELADLALRLLAEHTPEITLPFREPRGVSSRHILPVMLPPRVDRPRLMESLKTQGIQTSIHYPIIPHFSAFKASQSPAAAWPVAEGAARRELTLPLYPQMTDDDVHTVVQALRSALDEQPGGSA